MSGNGRPTGTRPGTQPMRQRRAVFLRIPAALARMRATIHACPTSRFLARSSRAARTSVRQTTAAVTARPRAMLNRSIRPQVTSVFDAPAEREKRVMSKDQKLGKPEDGGAQGGLKRRDLLLSGSSLLAASVLSGTGLTTSAQAQQAPPTGRRPNILVIMGDD